jgi:hypothetical protein
MRSFQLPNMFSLDTISTTGDIGVCSRGDEVWTADGSKIEFTVCWSALQSRVAWSDDNGLKDGGEGPISVDRTDGVGSDIGDLRSLAPLLKPNKGVFE